MNDIERQRVEQAYIDGSVEGSPIDRDGRPVHATPDLAAALRDRIRATLRDIEALAEMVHPDPDHPGIGVRMVSWAAVRNRIEHVLASEPVPATPACICGRAVPVAGTCFDIDGAYWSGHGEPVPATGRPDVDTEALYRENEAALVPATGNPGPYTVRAIPDSPMWLVVNDAGESVLVDAEAQARHVAEALNALPVPATGNPCPVAGCNALNLHYHGRMQYGSATGNPEGIDVEALGRFLHGSICSRNAAHFPDDDISRCYALAREYARQREGERPVGRYRTDRIPEGEQP